MFDFKTTIKTWSNKSGRLSRIESKNGEVYKLTNCEELSKYTSSLQVELFANMIVNDNSNTNDKFFSSTRNKPKELGDHYPNYSLKCAKLKSNIEDFCLNARLNKKTT